MIKNAKIVSTDTSPDVYAFESEERGSPKMAFRAHIGSELLRNARRWLRGYESPGSKSLAWGTLFDCALLTPTRYGQRYSVLPDDAPRRPSERQRNAKKNSPESAAAIEWWDDFLDKNPGEIIDAELDGEVHAAIRRLGEDKLIADLIETSQHQVMATAEWQDDPTGLTVPVKCLIDVMPPADHPIFGQSLYDVKTTKAAAPRAFAMDAQRYRYDLQAGLYLDVLNAATGENRSDFGHIVIENFPPFEYRTPPPLLSQRFLQFGRHSYQAALGLYCRCLCSGKWPSYDVQGASWPLTDCADWFLDMATIFQPIEEPEPDEDETPAPEPLDVIP